MRFGVPEGRAASTPGPRRVAALCLGGGGSRWPTWNKRVNPAPARPPAASGGEGAPALTLASCADLPSPFILGERALVGLPCVGTFRGTCCGEGPAGVCGQLPGLCGLGPGRALPHYWGAGGRS